MELVCAAQAMLEGATLVVVVREVVVRAKVGKAGVALVVE